MTKTIGICECGSNIYRSVAFHENTKKHLKYLQQTQVITNYKNKRFFSTTEFKSHVRNCNKMINKGQLEGYLLVSGNTVDTRRQYSDSRYERYVMKLTKVEYALHVVSKLHEYQQTDEFSNLNYTEKEKCISNFLDSARCIF